MGKLGSPSRRHFLYTTFGALVRSLPAANRNAASSSCLVSSGLWRWLNGTGLERFDLLREPNGWTLRGTVLALGGQGPVETTYKLFCDSAWRTQQANLWLRDKSRDRQLRLAFESGRWFENGQERNDLAGCIDIDLGWSPSTNTIAIRRLNLPLGARSGLLTMAWVRFPELTIEPLTQEYQRLNERLYRYTSRSGFSAVIEVDEEGLVVEYEGVWKRIVGTRED